jgi:hypothetical protein
MQKGWGGRYNLIALFLEAQRLDQPRRRTFLVFLSHDSSRKWQCELESFYLWVKRSTAVTVALISVLWSCHMPRTGPLWQVVLSLAVSYLWNLDLEFSTSGMSSLNPTYSNFNHSIWLSLISFPEIFPISLARLISPFEVHLDWL